MLKVGTKSRRIPTKVESFDVMDQLRVDFFDTKSPREQNGAIHRFVIDKGMTTKIRSVLNVRDPENEGAKPAELDNTV